MAALAPEHQQHPHTALEEHPASPCSVLSGMLLLEVPCAHAGHSCDALPFPQGRFWCLGPGNLVGASRSGSCFPDIPVLFLPPGSTELQGLNLQIRPGLSVQLACTHAESLHGFVFPYYSFSPGYRSWSQGVNPTAWTFLPGLCMQVLWKLFSGMSQLLGFYLFFFF